MSSTVRKGIKIKTCSGRDGCPNRVVVSDGLPEKIGRVFSQVGFPEFLEKQSRENRGPRRGFSVAVSDCPNGCSQPQIKDIGIIGACAPRMSGEECTQCNACVDVCKEDAVSLTTLGAAPRIDEAKCVSCAQCIWACPTGTLVDGPKGFRVLVGGKLGRHPRLGREMPWIYDEQQVLEIIRDCLEFYMENSRFGERFGHILSSSDFDDLVERHPGKGSW